MAKKKLSYAETLQQLESIVQTLETGSLDVDTLGGKVKEALALVKDCKQRLRTTEEAIEKTLEDLEE